MAKVTPTTAPAGKPQAQTASTKPQGEDKKNKGEKKEREARPERADFLVEQKINVKDPAQYPFKGTFDGERLVRATPAAFDFSKHERLSKKDFDKPSLYVEHRAEEAEFRAKELRQKAAEMRAGGDKKGSGGKANRLIKAILKSAEIEEELKAAGVDVVALIQRAREEVAKKKQEAATAGKPAGAPKA